MNGLRQTKERRGRSESANSCFYWLVSYYFEDTYRTHKFLCGTHHRMKHRFQQRCRKKSISNGLLYFYHLYVSLLGNEMHQSRTNTQSTTLFIYRTNTHGILLYFFTLYTISAFSVVRVPSEFLLIPRLTLIPSTGLKHEQCSELLHLFPGLWYHSLKSNRCRLYYELFHEEPNQ